MITNLIFFMFQSCFISNLHCYHVFMVDFQQFFHLKIVKNFYGKKL